VLRIVELKSEEAHVVYKTQSYKHSYPETDTAAHSTTQSYEPELTFKNRASYI